MPIKNTLQQYKLAFFCSSQLFSIISVVVTILAAIEKIPYWYGIIFIILFIGLNIIFYKTSYRDHNIYRTSSDINNYMSRWISNRGITAIFTRDMSWANDDEKVKEVLLKKAQQNDLIIVLPELTHLSNSLKEAGAKILVYKDLAIDPDSRFTIIRYGKPDSAIAIGKTHRGIHHINEYHAGENHVINVANDLIRIIEAINEKN